MGDTLKLIWWAVIGLLRSRASLEAEILTLRHQLKLTEKEIAEAARDGIRWHRAGFHSFWRWKSRCRGGRPKVALEICHLIRDMAWPTRCGAPRIHGELLKLGIDVGQTSVAKYMARYRRPPSQGWKTFLRNHADGIASIDLFVVPTLSFRLLYGLLILRHGRRQILWLGVTVHPTAEWIARQLTEACGWEWNPRYIVRDRDRVYRLRDHVVIFGDRHLRHVLLSYMEYYRAFSGEVDTGPRQENAI